MVSHPRPVEPPPSAPRTGGPWRPWRAAWVDAAYAPAGFWSTQQPGEHFATAVGAGSLVARAVATLLPAGGGAVVDVGAGDGRLLASLVDLLPGRPLVGVDRRPRPADLHPRVAWSTDHWDVDQQRWVDGGPDVWVGSAAASFVAHEWLDDLPVPVVERHADGWCEVEVDASGGERPGRFVGPGDRAWLARWWAEGRRAEVGSGRDAAWRALVRAALDRGGVALAVDYGHRAGLRPPAGTFVAYGRGRRRTPVPDGSVNLTAAVAVDALEAAGETLGARTRLLERQADVLARLADPPGDPLQALVHRGERAALTDPARWGDVWWLLQGAP